MKLKIFLLIFIIYSCTKQNIDNTCSDQYYKGKLVLKGICMNYVIEIIEGQINPDLIESEWINEFNNKKYNNVFALESVCYFPENLNEEDEFKFIINNTIEMKCAVCLAYSPTPKKSLKIEICK